MSLRGRAYQVPQSHAYGYAPRAARPQLVGSIPQMAGLRAPHQLVGAYPQLVGAGSGYPQLVGAPVGGGYDASQLLGTNPGSNGTYLVDGQPTQTRQWPFPLSRVTIQGGGEEVATAIAQLICRPVRLFVGVSGVTIDDISIEDIFVGQRSQLINGGAGSLPASMFDNVAIDSLVNFDTAQVGNSISIEYANENGHDIATVRTTLLCVTAAY